MVSFVCNSCQDTMKKNKLDQHASRCKWASFSCIDCSVDFQGVDYRLHTSCITEEEKYQGALYKPKKAKVEKVLAPVKVVAPVKVETAKKPTLIAQIEEKLGKVVEEPTKKEEAAPAKEIDGAEKQIRKVVKSTLKRLSSDAPMSLQALKKRIVDKVVEKNSELSEKKVGKQLEQIMMIKEVDGKITLEI